MKTKHGQIKSKTFTPTFSQRAQWEASKAAKQARKQGQMPPAKSMAATMPPEDGSCDEVTMDNVAGCQADGEHGEQAQMQQSAEHEQGQIAYKMSSAGDATMGFPLM
jgi:hypothetical protein